MDDISYERCVYESVDDKSLFWDVSQNLRKTEFMQQRAREKLNISSIRLLSPKL